MPGLAGRMSTVIKSKISRLLDRAEDLLGLAGIRIEEASVLMVGITYKAGLKDVRESCSVKILKELATRGAQIAYHDHPAVSIERGTP